MDRVVDGDTVDVTLDLGLGVYKKERVRLHGIDTPECRSRDLYEKKLGNDAAEYVRAAFPEGSVVRVVVVEESGKYGRLLADIYRPFDDTSMNQRLVTEGYAFPYQGGHRGDRDLADLERVRRARGTWLDV